MFAHITRTDQSSRLLHLSYLLPAGLRGARPAGDARPGRGEEAGFPSDSKAQFAFQLKGKKNGGASRRPGDGRIGGGGLAKVKRALVNTS